jgi:hypothetical protein
MEPTIRDMILRLKEPSDNSRIVTTMSPLCLHHLIRKTPDYQEYAHAGGTANAELFWGLMPQGAGKLYNKPERYPDLLTGSRPVKRADGWLPDNGVE